MAAGPEWRQACVTRAQTIARDLRMIDLAIEGPLPRIRPGSRADIVVAIEGVPAIRSFHCIAAPHGRVRITVGTGDTDGALRFMWSLVEGATVRMTVPAPQPDSATGAGALRAAENAVPPFAILSAKDAIIVAQAG